MAYIISIPVMILALMFQLAILSQLPLMSGTADLILLILIAWALQPKNRSIWVWALVGGGMVSVVSAMPFGFPLIIYLVVVTVSRLFQHQTSEIPVLGMVFATIIGTFIQHIMEIAGLFVSGSAIPFGESLSLVTLPSLLLNLLFALPVYVAVSDLAHRVLTPVEVHL